MLIPLSNSVSKTDSTLSTTSTDKAISAQWEKTESLTLPRKLSNSFQTFWLPTSVAQPWTWSACTMTSSTVGFSTSDFDPIFGPFLVHSRMILKALKLDHSTYQDTNWTKLISMQHSQWLIMLLVQLQEHLSKLRLLLFHSVDKSIQPSQTHSAKSYLWLIHFDASPIYGYSRFRVLETAIYWK